MVVEGALLDREQSSLTPELRVTPDRENVEISYTGLSFIKPEQVRFRYRLEGVDSDWVEAGTRRVAYYSHLPPGSYTFNVIAANSDGVWNTQGASVHVLVVPPFYRTWWFLAPCVVSIAAASFLRATTWASEKRERDAGSLFATADRFAGDGTKTHRGGTTTASARASRSLRIVLL